MARVNHKARLLAAAATLPSASAGILADLIESMVVNTNGEEISELETAVRSSRRKAKAEVADEKPARRSRRSAKAEVEEKPARKSRRAKAEVADEKPARRTRKPKAEVLPEDVTVDDLFEILDSFEGEPVAGTLRDLKPLVEAYGVDVKAFLAELDGTAKEKAVELGMMLAALQSLEAQIKASIAEDDDAMAEIIEELDLELRENARASTIAKAIIVAMHEEVEEGDDEDEGEDDADDEDNADDEEEEVAPRRRRRAKAEVEEKPARKSRRAAKAKDEDEDDLEDLDDLDD